MLTLAVAFTAAGCAGGSDSSKVVRAWARAVKAGDNQRAASLFASDAVVIQGSLSRTFHTHQQALEWNARLPCSDTIVALARRGSAVTATFRLGLNRSHPVNSRAAATASATRAGDTLFKAFGLGIRERKRPRAAVRPRPRGR